MGFTVKHCMYVNSSHDDSNNQVTVTLMSVHVLQYYIHFANSPTNNPVVTFFGCVNQLHQEHKKFQYIQSIESSVKHKTVHYTVISNG